MPFRELTEDRLLSVQAFVPDELPEPEEAPGFLDLLPAAARQNNSLVSFTSQAREGRLDWLKSSDFDPEPYLGSYADRASEFAFADSPEDVERTKRSIDAEERDRAYLALAPVAAFAASFAAGAVDPLVLIPFGAGARAWKTAGLLRKGFLTARAGFLGVGTSELALQATQDTRQWGESALNVAAGTLLSGVLGTAAGALGSRARADALDEIARDWDAAPVAGGSPVGPAMTAAPVVPPTFPSEIKLQKSLGVARLSAAIHLSPQIKVLVQSPSQAAKRAALRLFSTPQRLMHELEGLKTAPAIEDRIGLHRALAGRITQRGQEIYAEYIQKGAWGARAARLTGLAPEGKLSWMEFRRRAGRALSQNDTDANPHVSAYAKEARKVLNFYKDGFAGVGVKFGDDVVGARSFRPRVYKTRRMPSGQRVFRDLVRDQAMLDDPTLTHADAETIALHAYDSIQGLRNANPFSRTLTVKGPKHLKSREIQLSDFLLDTHGFLDDDIDVLMRSYTTRMAPELELRKALGEISEDLGDVRPESVLGELAKEIREDYRVMTDAEPARAAELEAALKQDMEDLTTGVMHMRGQSFSLRSSEHLGVRTMRGVRRANVMAMGGKFMLAAMSDPGRIVMENGVRRAFGAALSPFVDGLRLVKMSKREGQLAGEILDLTLDAMARGLEDVTDEFGRHSRFERMLEQGANSFSVISGLAPWNVAAKTFSSLALQTEIGEVAGALMKGAQPRARDVAHLAHLGLDEPLLRKMGAQVWEHGAFVRVADTEKWDDTALIDAFRLALRKGINETIVTPGAADMPRFLRTETGKMLGQYKGYGISAVNRLLIPAAQSLRQHGVADAQTLLGLGSMVGLGAMSFAVRARLDGRELPDPNTKQGLGVWVNEGIDRSGVLGIYSDVNNMIEKLSRGRAGLSAVLGGQPLSRYASRSWLNSILGPTAGQAEDLATLIGAISAGDVAAGDLDRARRLLPYQNLWYTSTMFDQLEEATAGWLALPEHRRNR